MPRTGREWLSDGEEEGGDEGGDEGERAEDDVGQHGESPMLIGLSRGRRGQVVICVPSYFLSQNHHQKLQGVLLLV